MTKTKGEMARIFLLGYHDSDKRDDDDLEIAFCAGYDARQAKGRGKMSKEEAIKVVCALYDFKWPVTLPSGVMFYEGHKITIDEFNKWARKFK